MINIDLGFNVLLGFLIIFAVFVLYFLRAIKYEVSRDTDIFFTTLGLIYSLIIMVHGWRLDPILLFSQILLVVTLLAIGWENIRLRALINDMLELKRNKTK